MDIIQSQIADQIGDMITLYIHFTDDKPEVIPIYKNQRGLYFIEPQFRLPKLISPALCIELTRQITGNKISITDPFEIPGTYDEIKSGMSYDDFFTKYYNQNTLGIKDAALALKKTEGRIRQILNKMDSIDLEALGIYKNSSGWQIPPDAMIQPPLSDMPGSGKKSIGLSDDEVKELIEWKLKWANDLLKENGLPEGILQTWKNTIVLDGLPEYSQLINGIKAKLGFVGATDAVMWGRKIVKNSNGELDSKSLPGSRPALDIDIRTPRGLIALLVFIDELSQEWRQFTD